MLAAGYSPSFARSRHSGFFHAPKIAAYLDARYHPIAQRCGVSVEWAIKQLVAMAGADIRQVASWDEYGVLALIPSDQLTPEQSAIIEAVEQESNEGESGCHTRIKCKIAPMRSRLEALRELRHYMQVLHMMPDEPKEAAAGGGHELMDVREAVRVLHRLGRPPINRAALLEQGPVSEAVPVARHHNGNGNGNGNGHH